MSNVMEKFDANEVIRFENGSKFISYLKNKENCRFTVGDILIRQFKGWQRNDDDKVVWNTELTSATSGAARKYVYVHENEFGIGYIKQLTANGKGLGKELICAADINHEQDRFLVDPDFQDHTLFGDENSEFNYNDAYKAAQKRKRELDKKNKAITSPSATWAEANAWMSTLKPGDSLWMGWDAFNASDTEYEVHSIACHPLKDWQKYKRWSRTTPPTTETEFYVMEVHVKGCAQNQIGNYERFTDDMLNQTVFTTQPYLYKQER